MTEKQMEEQTGVLQDSPEQEDRLLNAHLGTALSTPSGKVLWEWLAVQCCMRGTTADYSGETALSLAARNAVRDIFINLETRIKENESHARIDNDQRL